MLDVHNILFCLLLPYEFVRTSVVSFFCTNRNKQLCVIWYNIFFYVKEKCMEEGIESDSF